MLSSKLRWEDIFSIDGVKYVDYSRDLFMDMPILIEKLWPQSYGIVLLVLHGVTSVALTPRSWVLIIHPFAWMRGKRMHALNSITKLGGIHWTTVVFQSFASNCRLVGAKIPQEIATLLDKLASIIWLLTSKSSNRNNARNWIAQVPQLVVQVVLHWF